MNAAKRITALVVWITWLTGAVYMQYLAGWRGIAIYIIGSVTYAVWCRLLGRSTE